MPFVTDGAEPAWFTRIHAATTSWTRFRVLGLATERRVTPTAVARELACDPKAATQHLNGLAEQGLVKAGQRGAFEATAEGQGVHARLLAAGDRPEILLAGRRLLAIRYDEVADRRRLRRKIESDAEMVLRADGDIDLIGIFRDDADLIADLERSLRAAVSMTVRARIAD
jgi:hypothetical protein